MEFDFEEYSLKDLYDFSSGLSKKRSEFGFGNPFLTFKDVFHNIFVPSDLTELVNTSKKEQDKCSIKRGDVFLTRTSEKQDELGMSSVALKDYDTSTFNGFTKRLRPKSTTNSILLPEYSAFYFRSKEFRDQILSMTVMSTRASLNNSMLSMLTIKIPSIKVQRQIIKLLHIPLQKEILNNQIIANLEELAQTLFKRWFVDFEFPNENGEPYRSSGGKMVESELGMIPEGWEVRSLDDIANYQNGLAMQKYRPTNEEIGYLPVLKIRELNKGITDSNSDICSKNIKDSVKVEDGDIIFSWSGTLLIKPWVGGSAGLNQHLFKVTSLHNPKWFYYSWTKFHLNRFISIAQDKATTMGHIKRSHLKEAKILLPSEKTMESMAIQRVLLDKIIKLGMMNKNLSTLRDTLLPKLLSGEVEQPSDSEVSDDVSV